MRLPARSTGWLLLPLLLTGCHHKTQVAQNLPLAPLIEEPPPQLHLPQPNELPPPDVTAPVQQPTPVVTPPQEPPKKPARHRKPQNTQQASAGGVGVPAIGVLSTGDPVDKRQQTDASIESTEKSLNSINRTLSDQEAKTAAQIREFLKEARAALTAGDIEGAHTLAVKAKVLLDELRP